MAAFDSPDSPAEPPSEGGYGEGYGAPDYGTDSAPAGRYDRMPPQDLAAEQGVLGGMLLSKDAIADVIDSIKGRDFYKPAHELIYDSILDLYGRGEPADAVTVADALNKHGELSRIGGAPYLHTLMASVPTAANAGYYAVIVRERAILRRLVEAGTRITQMGYSTDGADLDEIVNKAQQEIYGVTEQRASEDFAPLSDIMEGALDEIESISNRSGQMTGVPTGFADLDALTQGLHPGQMVIIAARPAIGKALALDTPLPTPDGWTTMGEVKVGDLLIAADGNPTRVTAATEALLNRPCYEVRFNDGTVIVADAQHQWLTETRASRRSAQQAERGRNRYKNQRTFGSVKTTEEIGATIHCDTADKRLNHAVPVARPLALPDAELPLPPYVLGAWLGDGSIDCARLTTADLEMTTNIEAEGVSVQHVGRIAYTLRLDEGDVLPERACVVCGRMFRPQASQVRSCGEVCGGRARFVSAPVPQPTCPDCGAPSSGLRRCQNCHNEHGTVQGILRSLGVLGDKHIPAQYLRASEQQRRALLAGLSDTAGYINRTGTVQFAVTEKSLAEGAHELILSLGYRATMTTKVVAGRTPESSIAYIVTFTPADKVFRLTRKLARQSTRDHPSTRLRYVTEVRAVASVPVRCVEVDNADHLYLASRSWIPTHNSTLGLDLARSCSIRNGLASVIFSLEMSRNEITMRLLSAEARVALHHMRAGTMTDEDWAKMARRMGEVSAAPMFIDDSPNMSMMEIRAKCRRLKQRHDLRLVIIDYMQLMSHGGSRRAENRQQEVSELSRSLKLLAKEIEVPVIAISQLNRGPEQRTDKRPMMSDLRESGCVTAETRILRADTGAEVTIGELVASGERDIPVWAVDERLGLVRGTMTHAFPSGVKQVFRLKLSSGREIRATANHPFLTFDGWKPLGELEPGVRLGVPRKVGAPDQVEVWPDTEIVMLAHMLGDGCVAPRQPIHYTSADEANLMAVETAAAHFGITPERVSQQGWTHVCLPSPHRLTHGKRNPIAAWLDKFDLYGKRSYEKFLPAEVFGLPDEKIAFFLRHLWAAAGSVQLSDKGAVRVYYATTSERLARDLQLLLSRLDIRSRLRRIPQGEHRPSYWIDISGVDDQTRFLQYVGVHGARGERAEAALAHLAGIKSNTNVDTVPKQVWTKVRATLAEGELTHRQFQAALGTKYCGSALSKPAPSRSRLAAVAAVLADAELQLLATSDVFWDEVLEIEPLGEEPVFDATVPGVHNFVANGISIHNSLEQDADVVILLHREDAYERESPRAGEADLIVAKHRNGPTATITVAFQGHYSRFVDMAQS
jgi:replicative DNA helicase